VNIRFHAKQHALALAALLSGHRAVRGRRYGLFVESGCGTRDRAQP
jgi:hypothetical protein